MDRAALFGMDTESLSGGEVLEKWSHARAEIARDLEALAISRIGPARDDARWGVPDHWSAPFETIRSRRLRGLCDRQIRRAVDGGLSKDDVKIVILKNTFPNEDHAVLAVRVDGEWLILDNRTLTLVRDRAVTRAILELVLDQGASGASSRKVEVVESRAEP
jgi:predicted transglutaminase-like cysteine proteinase